MTMYESDFAKKVYVSKDIEDLDLHEIIDLKTYMHQFNAHIFSANTPEDFWFTYIDDFWDLTDQNFIFKTANVAPATN